MSKCVECIDRDHCHEITTSHYGAPAPHPLTNGLSVVVYGPQGCGKTRHAEALAKYFGLAHWCDWDGARDQRLARGHLILTNLDPRELGHALPPQTRAFSFPNAMRMAGLK
ncbi:MAG TPA: hypothetical protein VLJ58_00320 [Ramlibacter sp.]|nr:hypothetical protein [Ramlibacter sp.]